MSEAPPTAIYRPREGAIAIFLSAEECAGVIAPEHAIPLAIALLQAATMPELARMMSTQSLGDEI